MRRTLLLLAVTTGAAYLLGIRTGDASRSGRHHSLYQRAALLWTAPAAVRARRGLRARRRRLRGRLGR